MENIDKRNEINDYKILTLQNEWDKWFETNARSFPWRETSDPFKILIAEKLLHQTAAKEHLTKIYTLLANDYGTPAQLASVSIETLQSILTPLGLFKRAEELINLSGQILNNYHGIVPQTLEELQTLKGVGDYIARAVLCFGFGQNISIVDTNVARWLFRLLLIPDRFPKNPARNKNLIKISQHLVPPGNAKRYNWAILDLCAKVCLPQPHPERGSERSR